MAQRSSVGSRAGVSFAVAKVATLLLLDDDDDDDGSLCFLFSLPWFAARIPPLQCNASCDSFDASMKYVAMVCCFGPSFVF